MYVATEDSFSGRCVLVALAALLLIGLSGCGGASMQRELAVAESLAHAGIAAEVANTEDAERYAARELAIAEEKLREARHAADRGDTQRAQRLIAEALVNVELAKAKAAAGRANADVEDLQAASSRSARVR